MVRAYLCVLHAAALALLPCFFLWDFTLGLQQRRREGCTWPLLCCCMPTVSRHRTRIVRTTMQHRLGTFRQLGRVRSSRRWQKRQQCFGAGERAAPCCGYHDTIGLDPPPQSMTSVSTTTATTSTTTPHPSHAPLFPCPTSFALSFGVRTLTGTQGCRFEGAVYREAAAAGSARRRHPPSSGDRGDV